MMLLLRPRGAGELRGHRQQAALKDQRFREREPRWRRRWRQWVPPINRHEFRLGANDGARAFGADADDDGVVAAALAAMVLVGGAG